MSRARTDATVLGLLATVLSVGAYAYFRDLGTVHGYKDAVSHLLIGRRVVVGQTTGFVSWAASAPADLVTARERAAIAVRRDAAREAAAARRGLPSRAVRPARPDRHDPGAFGSGLAG